MNQHFGRRRIAAMDKNAAQQAATAFQAAYQEQHWMREDAEKKVADLQAIVDKLPKTKDGVLIYPGCGIESVWSIGWEHNISGTVGEAYSLPLHFLEYDSSESVEDIMLEDATGYSDWLGKCYSNREAALAARKED